MAATSVSASAFLGSWATGEDHSLLQAKVAGPPQLRVAVRPQPMMGSSKGGIFAPAVVVTRNIIGKKRFNQLRGKAIALHTQVTKIPAFCFHSKYISNQQIETLFFICSGDNRILQIDRSWQQATAGAYSAGQEERGVAWFSCLIRLMLSLWYSSTEYVFIHTQNTTLFMWHEYLCFICSFMLAWWMSCYMFC